METRKSFQESMERRAREWGERIDDLREKADHTTGELRTKLSAQVEMLREKQKELNHRLEALRGAGEQRWSGLKDSAEEAFKDFKRSIEHTVGRFSKR